MIYLLLALLAVLPFLLWRYANRQHLGLKGQMLHPFNLLGVFILLIGFDFLNAWWAFRDGRSVQLGPLRIHNSDEILLGFLFFLLCMIFVVAGIRVALLVRRKRRPSPSPRDQRVVAFLFVAILAVSSIVTLAVLRESLAVGSIFHVAAIRQNWFRENQAFQLIFSMVLPAFFLFVSRQTRWSIILAAAAATFCILVLNGGRGTLMMIIIACAFKLSQTRRMPLLYLYAALPAVGLFLIAYGFYARHYMNYLDLGSFLAAHGGIVGSLFNTLDISIAEAISINLAHPFINREPYSFLIGGLISYIPRDWIPWKIYGASAAFSMAVDPNRWLLVKSEWTITGFANLYYDFGYLGAVFLSGVLAYLWTRLLLRSARNSVSMAFGGVCAIQALIVFVRADLYNLGLLLWSFLLVLGLHRAIRVAMHLSSRIKWTKRLNANLQQPPV